MIAIDTNVLVRLLLKDDPAQSKASHKLFASEDIFIPDTVLLETEWILRAVYELDRPDVCAAFRRICGLKNVTLTHAQLFAQVIDWHEEGFDFADAFHLALSHDHDVFKTFDGSFIKIAKKFTAHRVEK